MSYEKEIHQALHQYANVPIGRPLKLGDFGTLDGALFEGHLFSVEGSVSDKCGFTVKERPGKARSLIHYMSKGAVDVDVGAAAKVGTGAAAVQADAAFQFKRENAMYVRFRECRTSLIENVDALTKAIAALDEKGEWHAGYYVVCEITHAEDVTVLIAGERGATSELALKGPEELEELDLGDARVSLSAKKQNKMAMNEVAKEGLTPLFGLRFLRYAPFIRSPRLGTKAAAPAAQGKGDPELVWVP